MALSAYEQDQLTKVAAHKERALRQQRRLLPFSVDDVRSGLFDRLPKVPGLAVVTKPGAALLDATASGAGKLMAKTSDLTTSPTRVIAAYAKKGHPVTQLEDIGKLDLRIVDDVASFGLLHHAYSLSAAVEGVATGLAVSGGEAVATAGAAASVGAAAGPGLGTVAAAMGFDVAALLTACSGVVAQDALYYGYDPREPAEEIFLMQVIGLGLAASTSAKAAAYQRLTMLTESLARKDDWDRLDEQTFAKVAQRFAVNFGQSVTRKKLAQLVPVVGVGIGAALNWKTVAGIADAAYWAYRERFLYEKSGKAAGGDVDVIDILNSEGVQIDGPSADEDT
ncbi:EcsC family protein [Mycobacterium shigaense]|uniref:EcsC family protein n=1 Tax=Mycobacterium shigaense TaxID=722731 RepID=UPI000E594D2B|nr:EcsC family protein [Mycobacterium shigaense]MEA1125073.1 EcsC family protein [Mycobacterium shigaense]